MIENKVVEKKQAKTEGKTDVETMINGLVSKAHKALEIMDSFDQEKVDHITHQMVMAGQDKHMELARWLMKKLAVGLLKIRQSRTCMPPKRFGTVFVTTRPLGLSRMMRSGN